MLKYTNYQLSFAEIPEETNICINISNCPNHCPDCHSKWLWNDAGYDLTTDTIDDILNSKNAELATCIVFMGGDVDPKSVFELAKYIKGKYSSLKTGWYSGAETIADGAVDVFDYIKIGPYKKEYGSLNFETTNQRLYKIEKRKLINITEKFWL